MHCIRKSIKRRICFYLGLIAEHFVILLFLLRRYKILGHRVITPFGELDIIAQKSNKIIFIEVKYRFKKENIEYCIDDYKMSRLTKSAYFFFEKNFGYIEEYECHLQIYLLSLLKWQIVKSAL